MRTLRPVFRIAPRLLIAVAAVCAWSVVLSTQRPFAPGSADEDVAYVCPMHPDQTSSTPGTCPRCGMVLVKATPFDVRDYGLDVRTIPAPIRAGAKTTLQLKVLHPDTGAVVTEFEQVHERKFHLFVISQDMEYFQHIHPAEAADGTWTIDVTLPKPGYYKVLADVMPQRGAAQFLARPLVTAGYDGDLAASSAHLVPDAAATRTVDDLTATVTFDPPTFVAGKWGHIKFHLTDAARNPVSDLQTYLGAFGHSLIMSEDMADYVHSHPINIVPGSDEDGAPPIFIIPPDADLESLRGGPDVTFEGLMPRAGMYRAWTQFRRHERIYTFAATFRVVTPE